MLVVSRKEKESIVIEPVERLDPSVTLREAFAHGPIVLDQPRSILDQRRTGTPR